MFVIDSKIRNRIEPVVRRVLIVDPNMASARLIADIVKTAGAREVHVEHDQDRALACAREAEPGLVFIEHSGPRLDGAAFARALRRSPGMARRAPIVMVTAEATAAAIKGARDAGVHEFLRKPFTSADVLKRIDAVALKPRDWIEGVAYVGPDRRRFNSAEYSGPQKRKIDKPADAAEAARATRDQAMRILKAALDQFDNDPMQALRAIAQQVETLKGLARKSADIALTTAVARLEAHLAAGAPTKASLAEPIGVVLAEAKDPIGAEDRALQPTG